MSSAGPGEKGSLLEELRPTLRKENQWKNRGHTNRLEVHVLR